MRTKSVILCQLTCIVLLLCFQCYAQEVSSAELIKEAKQYDGKGVIYRGEAVGDIMIRGEYAWLNVNDGSNAIGIWINKELIKNVEYTGGYNINGDFVKIAGVFNRSCKEHGGDLDIHALSVAKISSGNKIYCRLNTGAIKLALALLCILLLFFFSKVLQSRRTIF